MPLTAIRAVRRMRGALSRGFSKPMTARIPTSTSALARGGSRSIRAGIYLGDRLRIAVYDFLPDTLLSQVVNLEDFGAVLAFDKWIGNADGRQSVFYRAMVSAAGQTGRPGFVVRMINHGFAMNGRTWDFPDFSWQGLYARRQVYDSVRSLVS
jgi:hypothetical protein